MTKSRVALAVSMAFLLFGACKDERGLYSTKIDPVIYGADNRIEASAATPAEQGAARAVAVLFGESSELSCSGANCTLYTLPYNSFFSPRLCNDEPFLTQNTLGFCTGFLVGPDLVATAGHCVTSQTDCSGIALYFRFVQEDADQSPYNVPASDVYYCTTLLSRRQSSSTGEDWAVIRLDRAVTGVTPLCIRRSSTPAVGTPVEVMGHPYTLPKKVAGGAQVKSVNSYYFQANVDTYGGNSGSPVFESSSMVVNGILVRGNADYVTGTDSQGSCTRSNVCSDTNGCSGTFEDATNTAKIMAYVPQVSCYVPTSCTTNAECGDGNLCNGEETCGVSGQCQPGTPIICNDGNPCTDDTCNPATGGCVFTNNTAPCDDGDACTVGDTCSAGSCRPGTDRNCDDGNPCTADSCVKDTGCIHTRTSGGPCDDGNACTSEDTCSAGVCVGNPVDGTACPNGTCQSGTCVPTCPTFTGNVSSSARNKYHDVGTKTNVILEGTLSCPAGTTTDVDLYLEAYKNGYWRSLKSSLGLNCVEKVTYNVGTSSYNGRQFRWRVSYYSGPSTSYTLVSCDK
jgi:V8-like Glu-specific endopeptidase